MLHGKRASHHSPDSPDSPDWLRRLYAWRWPVVLGLGLLAIVILGLAALRGLPLPGLFPEPAWVSEGFPAPVPAPAPEFVSEPISGLGDAHLVPFLAPLSWPVLLGVHLVLFLGLTVAVAGYSPAQYWEFGPGWANLVTFLRAVLSLPVFAAVLLPDLQTEVVIFFLVGVAGLAILLDGLDGWLARRFGQSSAFGARFDMEVDAFLILLLSVLVWQTGQTGAWVLWIGLLRYGFIAAGWHWTWLQAPLFPSRRRQTICVVQSIVLLLALLPFVPAPWSGILVGAGLLALVYSFAFDTIWLFRQRR